MQSENGEWRSFWLIKIMLACQCCRIKTFRDQRVLSSVPPMVKCHWVKFELLDLCVEVTYLWRLQTSLFRLKDFYSFLLSFFNPVITRATLLRDTLTSIVSHLERRVPKLFISQIQYAYLPCARCVEENFGFWKIGFQVEKPWQERAELELRGNVKQKDFFIKWNKIWVFSQQKLTGKSSASWSVQFIASSDLLRTPGDLRASTSISFILGAFPQFGGRRMSEGSCAGKERKERHTNGCIEC